MTSILHLNLSESELVARARSLMVSAQAHSKQQQVAIFGSSFNPMTMGHLDLIALLLRPMAEHFTTVCVIPAGQSPLKSVTEYAPAHDRLKMLYLGLQTQFVPSILERLRVETFELDRPEPSRMIVTLATLIVSHQAQEYYTLVCGYDHLAQFDRWYRWSEFHGLCTLKFYPRCGISLLNDQTIQTLNKLLQTGIEVVIVFIEEHDKTVFQEYCSTFLGERSPHLTLVCDPGARIASSASSVIRRYYHQHHDNINERPPGVPSEVHRYIIEHGCYKQNSANITPTKNSKTKPNKKGPPGTR